MKQSLLFLLAFILIQPVLDSFDVANYNSAIKHTSNLLQQQSALDEHCLLTRDHLSHQVEHDALNTALTDALEDSHCHVCHIPAFFSYVWHYPILPAIKDEINLLDVRFNSHLISPDLRPPIFSLIS